MTRKLIYIMGSAVIGIVSLLVVMLIMMGTGSLDATPTKLVFSSPSADKIYDGTPLVATDWELVSGALKEGHTANVQVSGTQTQVGTTDNHISVTVSDQKGADVTEYYRIEYQVGQLTVTSRSIEISAENAEKVYDGTPLAGTKWKVTDGSLAEGHTAQVTLTGSLTTPGQTTCSASVAILNTAGEDVSANYVISCNSALLTVLRRHVTLLSSSAEKVYDGVPVTAPYVTVADGSLATGHRLSISNTASLQNAGEKENRFVATVYDAEGNDVTEHYDLTYAFGSLKVHRISLSVQTDSAIKEYDGTPLVCNTWKSVTGSPIPGETLFADFTASRTDCGTAENTAVFSVKAQDGTDTTANYAIEIINGTLTVTAKGFTVVSATATKEYDGLPLTDQTTSITSGELAEGHTLVATFTGSQLSAGSSANTFTVRILDQNRTDVTANYAPALIYGNLTVTKRPITVSSVPASKVYDGTVLADHQTEILLGSVADGETAVIVVTGEQTLAGSSPNRFTMAVYDAEGRDVSTNYTITPSFGELTVLKRSLTLLSGTSTKVYDGVALTNETVTVEAGSVAEGQTAEIQVTGTITEVGEAENIFAVKIVNEAEEDITANYDILPVYGTLTVTKRELTLSSESDAKVYDGLPLTNGTVTIQSGSVAEGQIAEIQVTGTVTKAEEVENIFTVTIRDNETDVTENYEITCLFGTLTVTKRELTIRSASDSKVYDGLPLVNESAIIEEGTVAEGQSAEILVTGTVTNATEVENAFTVCILDQSKTDVTENYEITRLFGTLTVTKRELTIRSASDSKVYDGLPLVNDATTIEDGTVAERQSIDIQVTGSVTEAREVNNYFTVSIWENETNVTENYSITHHYGTLTVTKRKLTVSSASDAKVYDALPLTNPSATIEEGTLAEGQSAELQVTGTITKAGQATNTVTVLITDGQDVNVTRNYDITYKEGTLTVEPLLIVVSTASGIKEYDGTPLYLPQYAIVSEQQLLAGHTVSEAVMLTAITNVADSPAFNQISCFTIADGDGLDVTENYRIKYEMGKLVILPREITVRTGSASKFYDGTELTCDAWKIVSLTTLLEGHSMQIAVSGTQTEVGESENITAEEIILDADGNEVTKNYDITYQYGILTVKGDPHMPDGGEGGGEGEDTGEGGMPGDGEESDDTPGEGEGTREEETSAIDGDGDGDGDGGGDGGGGGGGGGGDSSGISGPPADMETVTMLRIKTQKDVSVYLREKSYGNYHGQYWSAATPYDKTLEGAYGFTYLPATALENSGYLSSVMEIQNVTSTAYHMPYFTSMEEYRYDVQSSDVSFTGDGTDYALYFYDYNGYGLDLQSSDAYSLAEGAYRVHVYLHYLTIDTDTQSYMDGIIAAYNFDKNDEDIIAKVAAFIQTSAKYNLKYDRALDEEDNIVTAFLSEYKEGICQHYASAATMLFRALKIPARYTVGYVGQGVAGEWRDVTNKEAHAWVEVYIDGVGWIPVEVTGSGDSENDGGGGGGGGFMKPKLSIRPADAYMQYDINNPNAVLRPDGTLVGLDALLDIGYTYEAVISGERSLPGITRSKIASFILYNEKHEDVTDQFDITMSRGKIHVYMEELFVKTGGGSKVYDGTPLVNTEYTLTGDLLANHRLETLECKGSITGVGRKANTCTLKIVDESGSDVTDYYKINVTYGVLQITPRTLHIKANSAEKPYDGTPLVDAGYTVEGDLAAGDILTVTVIGTQTSIGRSDNTIAEIIITDAFGNNTLSNYKITYDNGKLFVSPPKK